MPSIASISTMLTAAEWVAKNYKEIPAIASKTSEFMNDVFTQGGIANTVKQIGNTIIWNRPDGASHVIGMLDQIDNRIDGLELAQHGIQAGLSGLKSLSMVTLGFSGVSVALLTAQFVFLSRRLNQIQKETKKIQLKIDQHLEAKLKTGLNFLEAAGGYTGDKRIDNYHDALEPAREAGHFFGSQAIDPAIHEEQLPLIQFYARKYFLALSIELGSLLGLEQTDEIRTRLNAEESNLKTIASQIFKQTLSKDIEFYLSPEMQETAKLENISEIMGQAQKLGCIPIEVKVAPADVFESNRKKIYSSSRFWSRVTPAFHSFRKNAAQKLQIAHGTFEEITRLLSWREAVGYLSQNGRSVNDVASEFRHFRDTLETPTNATPFAAYSLSPKSA